jgi:streptogramin lyase
MKLIKKSLFKKIAFSLCALILTLTLTIPKLRSQAYADGTYTITTFSPTTPQLGNIFSITTGSDGNLWFTGYQNNTVFLGIVGKITPQGIITEYQLPSNDILTMSSITSGPDGNLWLTASSYIMRITPTGEITQFPQTVGESFDITSGPDGNLWFTGTGDDTIGKITTSGVVTKFQLPVNNNIGDSPHGITSGHDGNLWFTNWDSNQIGRITPSGTITEFDIPTSSNSAPLNITSGPDGNLWFTQENTDQIGKITPSGVISEYLISDNTCLPQDITKGPDNNLWFTCFSGEVGKITPNGIITLFPVSSQNIVNIQGITTGPDGNLWLASAGDFTKLNISEAITPTPSPTPISQDTGFRPSRDGFGFVNPDDPSYLIPKAAFEQFFGKDETTTSIGTLTTFAQAYYNDLYSVAAQIGECFGISGASAINFEDLNQSSAGNFALPYIKHGYSSVASYSYVPPNSQYKLEDILGYYQGLQYGSAVQYIYQNKNNSPAAISSLLSTIESSIQADNPIAVSLWKEASNHTHLEGHTLLAYEYQTEGNITYVYVYDSNHPAKDDETITFNSSNDAWYYNANDVIGAWGTGITGSYIQTVPISLYTQNGILPLSFNSTTSIVNVPYIVPYITDASGAVTGIVNGQYSNNANGVTLLPVSDADLSATPSAQQFLTTLGNPYTLHITNDNGTQGPVDIFGPSAYISVKGITPNASDSAQISIGSDDKTATISASTKISNYSIELDQEVSGKSLVFTIKGASLNPGEITTVGLVGNNGELEIQNSGIAKTYSIEIQEVGGNNSTITLNNISIAKNTSQTWTPSEWDDLTTTPINLTESEGNTTSTVDANAIVINNGAKYTNLNQVTLGLVPPFIATKMRISNTPIDKNQQLFPQWQNFTSSKPWTILGGEGKQTVYVQFKSSNGTLSVSDAYSSSIILDTIPPIINRVTINGGSPFTATTSAQIKIKSKDKLSGLWQMKVSNASNLSTVAWQPYQKNFNWALAPLSSSFPQLRRIYVQVEDRAGNVSQTFISSILLLP